MKEIRFMALFLLMLAPCLSYGENAEKKALALTTSGGVSLGSYQSGLLYFANQIIKYTNEHELKLVTGASAGGINSLLTILDSCSLENRPPQESIFWKSWIPLGINTLYMPKKVGKYNLLSREQVEKILDLMEEQWSLGLKSDCEVVLSVSVTRANKYDLPIVERLTVPRLAESFIVKIKGRGAGIAPQVVNYPFPNEKRIRLLLPFKYGHATEAKDNFNIIRKLLFATAAFPLAFAPVPISYCIKKPLETKLSCDEKDTRTDDFLDGGVFDNGPIRMAFNLAANGLENKNKKWNWKKFQKPIIALPKDIQFAFIDTNIKEFPTLRDEYATEVDGVIELLYRFFSQFISSARTKELASLLEEYPSYASILSTTRNNLPLASEPLMAFLGFFEESFRRFDFYVGMYDAYRHMTNIDTKGVVKSYIKENTGTEQWAPLLCIISKFEASEKNNGYCEKVKDENFLILLETSFDRLAQYCTLEGSDKYKSCQGLDRNPVVGIKYHNDFQYFMELLEYRKLQFHDLDKARKDPGYATVQIQNILSEMNGKLASKQPGGQGFALNAVFKPALNYIKYTPAPSTAYISLGSGLEFGFSHVFVAGNGLGSRFRLHGALLQQGTDTVFGESKPITSITPMLGLEYESEYLSDEFTQYQFGMRGGYLLSTGDDFGGTSCDPNRSESRSFGCSQWVLGPTASVTILERLKFHAFGQVYPWKRAGSRRFQLMFFFGYQFLDIF